MNSKPTNFYTDAWRYDLVEGQYAAGAFLDFYLRQVSQYGEPVLELACGSGRLTIPLKEKGINITGLDISTEMLDLAKRKAAECSVDIPFIQGDMRAFNLNKKFQLIFIPAQSLSHLHRQAEIEACFSCVRQHLAKNGRFLIELFNPSLSLLARSPDETYPLGNNPYKFPDDPKRIFVYSRSRYDSATQVNAIQFIYKNEKDDEEQVLSFEMRQFFPQEIDALLLYNGFQIEHKYGDHDENLFSHASKKQLIVCQKN